MRFRLKSDASSARGASLSRTYLSDLSGSHPRRFALVHQRADESDQFLATDGNLELFNVLRSDDRFIRGMELMSGHIDSLLIRLLRSSILLSLGLHHFK